MKRVLMAAVWAALALALVAPAVAEARTARVERTITLSATATGRASDISGKARIRQRGSRQDFKVSMDARVADGTRFTVYVVNSDAGSGSFKVGTIRIAAGRGELELSNENGRTLPAGIAPVTSITTVKVVNGAGKVVLQGSF